MPSLSSSPRRGAPFDVAPSGRPFDVAPSGFITVSSLCRPLQRAQPVCLVCLARPPAGPGDVSRSAAHLQTGRPGVEDVGVDGGADVSGSQRAGLPLGSTVTPTVHGT